MAKSKKQDSTEKSAAPAGGEGAGAAKKRTTRTKVEAQPKAAAKGGAGRTPSQGAHHFPLIDTSLAASAAASMVIHRAGGAGGPGGASSGTGTGPGSPTPPAPATAEGAGDAGDKRETSTFKQLKQSLNKPTSQGLAGILGNSQAGKKSTQTFSGPNQVRRNQTFGADASRTNLPRRTGG
jgi:hypothetical protein